MPVNNSIDSNDELPVVFVDFNQDFSSLCVGLRSGYSLLSTEGGQVVETFSRNGDPMCLVGRLFTSNLVTLVSLNDMRKLLIFHYRRSSLICDYRYTHTISAVKMNRQRLVVCVEDGIFIHNIKDMSILHRIEDTPPNRNGVIAFSSSPDKCYLAYPGSHRIGTVFIFDALNFTNVVSIAAHDGLLAALALNSSSTMLATASEKGTVVRVFSIPDGDKLMEFRRGLARCASICSLSFSLDNRFLVAASNTETVHVFKLDISSYRQEEHAGCDSLGAMSRGSESDTNSVGSIGGRYADNSGEFGALDHSQQQQQQLGWTGGLMSWVGGALKLGAAYLPHQVSEVFSQDRAFAFAHIPLSTPGLYPHQSGVPDTHYVASGDAPVGTGVGLKKVAAITCHQNQYRLLVASLDGLLHIFSIDSVHGGEAVLLKTHNLLTPSLSGSEPSLFPASSTNPQPDGRHRLVSASEANTAAHTLAKPNTQNRKSFASACGDDVVSGQELIAAELSDVPGKPLLDSSDFPAFPPAPVQSIPFKKGSRKSNQ